MDREFTFYDYVDADGGGGNVIKSWLNDGGKDSKGYFTTMIPLLETSPPPRTADSVWGRNGITKPMRGEWSGFIELRKTGRVQYRLLAKMINRGVFLVACGIHKDQNYKTDVSPRTALNRVNQMMSNPAKYRREHEYN